MSEKCYLCGSTDGKCNHFPTPPASQDAGEAVAKALANAARLREELPHLIQPSRSDVDLVTLADTIATLTAEVSRLTGELEQMREKLVDTEMLMVRSLEGAGKKVKRLEADLAEAQRQRLPEGYITIPGEAWDAQMKIEGELEKETAHSKHLAGAMSRKIDELIAAENQCGYYKGQYTRCEQVRKEACEANVKAQAAMLWLEADLERSRQECERLREIANQYLHNMGFIETETKLHKDLTALSQPGKGE